MDKADWAILLAALSASFTGWQAWSAHVNTRIAKASQKRKKPIFEPRVSTVPERPGWYRVTVVVRNMADCAVLIHGVQYRRWRAVLVPTEAIAHDDGLQSGVPDVVRLDPKHAKRRIALERTASPYGSMHGHRSGPPSFFFFACENIDPRRLAIDWSWADGERQ